MITNPFVRKYNTLRTLRMLLTFVFSLPNVSESDILGPIDFFSDIENLVSFERALFVEYSFKYRRKILL